MNNTDLVHHQHCTPAAAKFKSYLPTYQRPQVLWKKIVRRVRRLNPLTNTKAMLRLNPYAAVLKRKAILCAQKRKLSREEELSKKRGLSFEPAIRSAKLQEKRRAQIMKVKKSKPKKAKKSAKAPAKK